MGNVLEAIAQTVSEVVGRVNRPLISSAVVRLLQHTVRSEIPMIVSSQLIILGFLVLTTSEGSGYRYPEKNELEHIAFWHVSTPMLTCFIRRKAV